MGEPSGAQSTSLKALDGETLANVAVEAKFNAVCKVFDAVSGYYKATQHEIQAEKAFFASLAVEDLDAVAEAYKAVALHVGIMTSDYQAQRAALETSRQLKDFYGKNGTSEDQIEHEAQASAAPRARPKAGRSR